MEKALYYKHNLCFPLTFYFFKFANKRITRHKRVGWLKDGIPNPIIKFRPKVLLSIKMGLNIIVEKERYFCVCYFF